MRLTFHGCELDLKRHSFSRNGEERPLEPQVFDLLALLCQHADTLVTRDQIITEVWQGRIVSEAAISSRINSVRRAIGDDGRRQAMLRTVPRLGFQFIGPVEVDGAAARPAASETTTAQAIRMTRSRDGTGIAFATTGQGPPLLRAGHFLTHLEQDWHSPIWRPILEDIGQHFSFVRYDQRATGLSDQTVVGLDLDCLVDDLAAVAEAAGLDRFPIFAASQGVPVAIAYAVRHPEKVSKLVLYGGYAQGRSRRGTAEERENAEAIKTVIRNGWGRRGAAFAAAFSTLYMPDATQDQIAHMRDLQLASATPENAVALRVAIDQFDVTGLLERVRAPTLVVHAREDSVHPVEQASVLATGIPGAELHVVEGRNHIPLWQTQSWQSVMQAMLRFLG